MGAMHLSSDVSSLIVNCANGDVRSFLSSAKHTFRHRWKEALDYGSRVPSRNRVISIRTASHLLPFIKDLSVDILDVDSLVDMAAARDAVSAKVVLAGLGMLVLCLQN